MKLTRHNGRSGKHGTYNPKHNDRRFDVENSEHIDAQRTRQNIYWDCFRGVTTSENQEKDTDKDFSWAIYFSHEYTVAFAGKIVPKVKKLLSAYEAHWDKFEGDWIEEK